jgi:hypothetical protein
MNARKRVSTPAGKLFSTSNEELASLICDDMNHYGTQLMGSLSYVILHATYLDFGLPNPKPEMIKRVLIGYTPERDIAFGKLSKFDSLFPIHKIGSNLEETGKIVDPTLYFGPSEDLSAIQNWLESQTTRVICAIQVCGSTFSSILVGYRLLRNDVNIPVSTLAQGVVRYSRTIHSFLLNRRSPKNTEVRIEAWLEKIKNYASFPDEQL